MNKPAGPNKLFCVILAAAVIFQPMAFFGTLPGAVLSQNSSFGQLAVAVYTPVSNARQGIIDQIREIFGNLSVAETSHDLARLSFAPPTVYPPLLVVGLDFSRTVISVAVSADARRIVAVKTSWFFSGWLQKPGESTIPLGLPANAFAWLLVSLSGFAGLAFFHRKNSKGFRSGTFKFSAPMVLRC